jgi:hypothetical protein
MQMMNKHQDQLASYMEQPVLVPLDEDWGNVAVDEDSNPLDILCKLEERGDWNYTPLEVLMANATPVPF